MKILYPFIDVPSIYFPVGKLEDGGTCEFASEKCLLECAVYKHLFSDKIIDYRIKEAIYITLTTQNPSLVASKILEELKIIKMNILCWFASGDCPTKDTMQIAQIARLLQFKGVNQAIITRSTKLHEILTKERFELDGSAVIGIARTIEDIETLKEDDIGLFVRPNYEEGHIDFFIKELNKFPRKTSCIGINGIIDSYKILPVESMNTCANCLVKGVGCFTK
jgi:hypothetical protein